MLQICTLGIRDLFGDTGEELLRLDPQGIEQLLSVSLDLQPSLNDRIGLRQGRLNFRKKSIPIGHCISQIT
jgi:hypothetical protein